MNVKKVIAKKDKSPMKMNAMCVTLKTMGWGGSSLMVVVVMLMKESIYLINT